MICDNCRAKRELKRKAQAIVEKGSKAAGKEAIKMMQDAMMADKIDTSTTPTKRTFAGGATRDVVEDKPSYVKALSPAVLRCYVEYIGEHRTMPDGGLRDWDNWKKGMPQDVYLDGMGRHFLSVWLLFDGFSASDNHGAVTIEDSLCGIIFNAQGMLHEILKSKKEKKCG